MALLGTLSSERYGDGRISLSSEQLAEVDRLLRAARSDLRAAMALAADGEQGNDVVGFHAQQAVEKAIKIALVMSGGEEIPYTHDLSFLLDLLKYHEMEIPEALAESDWLTPWAVAARYGASDAPLDRAAALAVANEAVAWAAAFVSEPDPDPPDPAT